MLLRTLPTLLAAMLACTACNSSLADDKPAPRPASVEQRLANLERQLETMLKEVQAIRKEMQPQAQIQILPLKHADAITIAQALGTLLRNNEKTLSIAADARTNSLLVRFDDPDRLKVVANLLEILDVPAKENRTDIDKLQQQITEMKSLLEQVRRQTIQGANSPVVQKITKELAVAEAELRSRIADADLKSLQERAAWAERMLKKGFLSNTQAEAEKNRLQKAQDDLAKAKKDLEQQTEKKPEEKK